MGESDISEYWVLETPGFSRKREVPDISESWVEGYGKFKTGEEKKSGFFEEEEERSSDMPVRRVEEILTFHGNG